MSRAEKAAIVQIRLWSPPTGRGESHNHEAALNLKMANEFMRIVPDLSVHTLVAVFIITICFGVFFIRFNERAATQGPTILTTLGILGTFVGITFGLLTFDSNNIERSIPTLLDGMKTAFFASCLGILFALILKARFYIFGFKATNTVTEPATSDVSAEHILSTLKSIQQALVGADDSTLISQLKLSRSDSNDRLDALKAAQIEALQHLSEMGSKALVEALRDVIKDFNSKISEQFGDNFKHLNEAVGRLLAWQDKYREHIEISNSRHDHVIQTMDIASDKFGALVGSAGVFSTVAADLQSAIGMAEQQRAALARVVTELTQLLTATSESIPQFEGKILEIARQISASSTEQQKIISNSLQSNAATIQKIVDSASNSLNNSSTEFNKHMLEAARQTKEQVTVLDRALSEELKKSLESLGTQLATLSQRFVQDYSPLTEKLRQLVQAAKV